MPAIDPDELKVQRRNRLAIYKAYADSLNAADEKLKTSKKGNWPCSEFRTKCA